MDGGAPASSVERRLACIVAAISATSPLTAPSSLPYWPLVLQQSAVATSSLAPDSSSHLGDSGSHNCRHERVCRSEAPGRRISQGSMHGRSVLLTWSGPDIFFSKKAVLSSKNVAVFWMFSDSCTGMHCCTLQYTLEMPLEHVTTSCLSLCPRPLV